MNFGEIIVYLITVVFGLTIFSIYLNYIIEILQHISS